MVTKRERGVHYRAKNVIPLHENIQLPLSDDIVRQFLLRLHKYDTGICIITALNCHPIPVYMLFLFCILRCVSTRIRGIQ